MKISLSASCKKAAAEPPLIDFQGTNTVNLKPFFRQKDKLVFVMGATGTGKSRLAVDLATRFPAEIVNSDKIQIYKGLEVVTNKVTEKECCGVPHHLLGIADPNSNFTFADFRRHATSTINSIVGKHRLPIVAGGSNSFIESLVDGDAEFRYQYECCFLWVDVSLPILHSFVSERVDRMLDNGFINEVRNLFDPNENDYTRGIRRAIGVPELDAFLRAEMDSATDYRARSRILEAAILKIKENTRKLAFRQWQNIRRLRSKRGWNLHRIDATEVFQHRDNKQHSDHVWEALVTEPASKILHQFLCQNTYTVNIPTTAIKSNLTVF
ncbi:adenylate isopentenyltransferase 5, chloroplastic-like [Cucurbita moschata]|uniref:adenylate dimethylallyltransferase (ADP/ATP-dependent) n=1 Tax=Cucurbita moschata TaxID=3662 RepID=A0A6J1EWK5_CUCMO|nr:adenylate isopentenyltransferase 5, chloroplastic-like [Cucurbita moschata]